MPVLDDRERDVRVDVPGERRREARRTSLRMYAPDQERCAHPVPQGAADACDGERAKNLGLKPPIGGERLQDPDERCHREAVVLRQPRTVEDAQARGRDPRVLQ